MYVVVCVHLVIVSFAYVRTHPFIHSLIHSFMHSFIHVLVRIALVVQLFIDLRVDVFNDECMNAVSDLCDCVLYGFIYCCL